MLFVTNNANCSSYIHPIEELFCLPKEKRYNSTLNLTLMTVIIYTGNKVKSNRGEKWKKASTEFFSFGQQTISVKYLAFSWHSWRKHHRILYLCSRIEDRWTPLRMQYFLLVLIHWEKSVNTASKTSPRGSKQLFYRLKSNSFIFKQFGMLHR